MENTPRPYRELVAVMGQPMDAIPLTGRTAKNRRVRRRPEAVYLTIPTSRLTLDKLDTTETIALS